MHTLATSQRRPSAHPSSSSRSVRAGPSTEWSIDLAIVAKVSNFELSSEAARPDGAWLGFERKLGLARLRFFSSFFRRFRRFRHGFRFELEQGAFAVEVLGDEIEVVVGKRQRVEQTRRAELRIATKQRFHRRPLPVPGKKPAHGYVRPFHHGAAVVVEYDVRVMDANGGKSGHGDAQSSRWLKKASEGLMLPILPPKPPSLREGGAGRRGEKQREERTR